LDKVSIIKQQQQARLKTAEIFEIQSFMSCSFMRACLCREEKNAKIRRELNTRN